VKISQLGQRCGAPACRQTSSWDQAASTRPSKDNPASRWPAKIPLPEASGSCCRKPGPS